MLRFHTPHFRALSRVFRLRTPAHCARVARLNSECEPGNSHPRASICALNGTGRNLSAATRFCGDSDSTPCVSASNLKFGRCTENRGLCVDTRALAPRPPKHHACAEHPPTDAAKSVRVPDAYAASAALSVLQRVWHVRVLQESPPPSVVGERKRNHRDRHTNPSDHRKEHENHTCERVVCAKE